MRPRSPLLRQPWNVLLALVLLQWLLLLLLTQRIVHNGWLFAQDGTATAFYSTAWSLAHGHLPPALVGYGWPLVTTPVAGIAGIRFLDGLPALVLVQTLVLLPLALFAVYGVASRIGGRALGYVTAAAWVLLPYAVHPLFGSGYHPTYVQQLLPQGLGLTGLGGFPSMVCVLVAAYFAVSSIDTADPVHAALGGLFAGFATAIDPANLLFLAAPAVGYALARRWSTMLVFGLALLPALATVTLWQYRGLGHVPHIHAQIDVHHLQSLRIDFRNVFYSDRLVEVPFVAGAIALARRSWIKSAFVTAWFLSYLLVRESAPETSVGTGSWYGVLLPALPAFVIACCSLPLLSRASARVSRPHRPCDIRRAWTGVTSASSLRRSRSRCSRSSSSQFSPRRSRRSWWRSPRSVRSCPSTMRSVRSRARAPGPCSSSGSPRRHATAPSTRSFEAQVTDPQASTAKARHACCRCSVWRP